MFLSAMKDGARSLKIIKKHVFWSCWYTLLGSQPQRNPLWAQRKDVSTVTKVVSNISSLNSNHRHPSSRSPAFTNKFKWCMFRRAQLCICINFLHNCTFFKILLLCWCFAKDKFLIWFYNLSVMKTKRVKICFIKVIKVKVVVRRLIWQKR